MSYETQEVLRDKNGVPIPQYWNVTTNRFEPLTGKGGATDTQVTGSIDEILAEPEVEISARGTYRLINTTGAKLGNYKYINIFVKNFGEPSRIRFLPTLYPYKTTYLGEEFYSKEFSDINSNLGESTGWVELMNDRVRLDLINVGENDSVFSVYVYGKN